MTRTAALAALCLALTACSITTASGDQRDMFKACVNSGNTPADCAKAVKEMSR